MIGRLSWPIDKTLKVTQKLIEPSSVADEMNDVKYKDESRLLNIVLNIDDVERAGLVRIRFKPLFPGS
jgi:hypothetical protein